MAVNCGSVRRTSQCVYYNEPLEKLRQLRQGLLYYQQCLPILNELKEADASVSNINSTLQGKITMSVLMDFAFASLPLTLGNLWKITLI